MHHPDVSMEEAEGLCQLEQTILDHNRVDLILLQGSLQHSYEGLGGNIERGPTNYFERYENLTMQLLRFQGVMYWDPQPSPLYI